MKIWNSSVILWASFGTMLGCAGAGADDESSEAEGESSSALQAAPHKPGCPPKHPLGADCKDCTRTKIGAPSWEPTGVTAIAGQVGSTTPDIFLAFLNSVVSPNHAFDDNDFIIGPAIAHAGPYDDEVGSLAKAKGFTPKQTFRASEFTAPGGIVILLNLVPSAGAPIGSSFDFASGPIIPNALFPIAVDGDLFRNGELYDAFFDSSYAGYLGMTPPILKDGPSHLPWFFGENSGFGPPDVPATGKYEFKLKITDNTGAGWLVQMPFKVKK